MADNREAWRDYNFRNHIIQRIEKSMGGYSGKLDIYQLEANIYNKARDKEDYLNLTASLILDLKNPYSRSDSYWTSRSELSTTDSLISRNNSLQRSRDESGFSRDSARRLESTTWEGIRNPQPRRSSRDRSYDRPRVRTSEDRKYERHSSRADGYERSQIRISPPRARRGHFSPPNPSRADERRFNTSSPLGSYRSNDRRMNFSPPRSQIDSRMDQFQRISSISLGGSSDRHNHRIVKRLAISPPRVHSEKRPNISSTRPHGPDDRVERRINFSPSRTHADHRSDGKPKYPDRKLEDRRRDPSPKRLDFSRSGMIERHRSPVPTFSNSYIDSSRSQLKEDQNKSFLADDHFGKEVFTKNVKPKTSRNKKRVARRQAKNKITPKRFSGAEQRKLKTLLSQKVPYKLAVDKITESRNLRGKRTITESKAKKAESSSKGKLIKTTANKESVNKNNNSTPTKEESLKNLEIGIADVGYPHKILNEDQLNLLQQALMKSIEDIPDQGPQVRFLKCILYPGVLILKCADKPSFNWVEKNIKHLKPWEGIQIKTLIGSAIPRPDKFTVYIPHDVKGTKLAEDTVLQRLKKMNHGLAIQAWEILECKEMSSGQQFTIAIDKHSQSVLEKMHYKAYFGFGQVTFNKCETKKK